VFISGSKGPAFIDTVRKQSDPLRPVPVEDKGFLRTLFDLPTGLAYLSIPAEMIPAC
jgi:hypothetical protein